MAKKYTKDADGHGWLIVQYADNSRYPPLPQYTLVDTIASNDGRVHFKILEGKSNGKTASLSRADYLADARAPHSPAGQLYYNRKKGQLWYGNMDRNKEGLACRLYPSNPPPTGTHDLEIPDEVHSIGSSYLSSSKYATTWFRIGHSGDRYLHPGTASLGCVTVTALGEWTNIYNYLIARRKGDGKSVGTIQIFER